MAKGSKFTNDYKKEIVRLITELGKKPSEVAEDIGVTATTVRRWVKQFSIHATSLGFLPNSVISRTISFL